MLKYTVSILTLCSVMVLAGCAQNISPDVYTAGQVGVATRSEPATIISMRQVTVDASSGVGGLVGAGAGAAAGTLIGSSTTTKILGGIGGAVVGGVAGSAAEKAIHKHKGIEYTLRLKRNKATITIAQVDKYNLRVGDRVLVQYGQQTRVVPAQ